MDQRLYFVLGDLASNTVVGAVIGWVSWLLTGTGGSMLVAMVIMMIVGMIIAFLLWIPLSMLFGAMEVMLPLMLTGMTSGMVVGMWVTMTPLNALSGFLMGGVCGFITITGIWIINNQLRGVVSLQGEKSDG